MFFPKLAIWSAADPEDPTGRIDRALDGRSYRLVAGLSLSARLDRVQGALVVFHGNGKYLRIKHVVEKSEPLPPAVEDACRRLIDAPQRNTGELAQITWELAATQAIVVEKLKRAAGKYVDRVLAVAVFDPGIWDTDFDGQASYNSMCDPNRLAELSGVSVIDSFPARDLSVGGNGHWLAALPYWLMFADRAPQIAHENRLLITAGRQCCTYWLPASDGLDAEVPEVKVAQTIGFDFLDDLISQSHSGPSGHAEFGELYAAGVRIEKLKSAWKKSLVSLWPNSNPASQKQPPSSEIKSKLISDAESFLVRHSATLADMVRTGVEVILENAIDQLALKTTPGHILIACPASHQGSLISLASQRFDNANVSSTQEFSVGFGELDAVAAATQGMFHIDQMPGNIPWLTGAQSQRILGRLTPGNPANWRQLVRTMADFHPAPMKLKDAV